MLIAGWMGISDYVEIDNGCFLDLLARVSFVSLWFDQKARHRQAEFEALIAEHGQHLAGHRILHALRPWQPNSCWLWREPLLRSLDDVRPDYVLIPDSDETFDDDFPADFEAFCESGDDLMMFGYTMVTIDVARVPSYPPNKHCKVIKWQPGLTFATAAGYDRPSLPGKVLSQYTANSRIRHYCFYTPELQARKAADIAERHRQRWSPRWRPPAIASGSIAPAHRATTRT